MTKTPLIVARSLSVAPLERTRAVDDSIDARIARLAASQHGAFARSQASALGATRAIVRHRIATERWHEIHSNVFVIHGAAATWSQSMLAALLFWGPGSVASHRAAAWMWSLDPRGAPPPELIVPRTRQRRSGSAGIVHRHDLEPGDVTAIDGIPVTTPVRTLVDLAGVAAPAVLERALDAALLGRLATVATIRARLIAFEGRRRAGIGTLRKLLDERDGRAPSGSALETRVLREIRRAGLPVPVAQHAVHDDEGVMAVDFAYPDHRLAIEVDGYRFHAGRASWERDRQRMTRLTVMGWRVVHVTWRGIRDDPAAVIEAIRRALRTS